MKKRFLLVTEEKLFFDPHGIGDYGGTTKHVYIDEGDDEYGHMVEGKQYDQYGELHKEDDEHWAEDGYNCEMDYISIKVISEEDYFNFKSVIEAYYNIP